MADVILLESGDGLLLEDGSGLYALEAGEVTVETFAYLQEDGLFNFLLEDGSGVLLLEDIQEVPGSSTFGIDTWEFDSPEDDPEDRDPIDYYIAWQMMDNGAEDRNKLIDKVRITAKGHNIEVQIHAASPGDEISKTDIEDGENARATIAFGNSNQVVRYEEEYVKIKNLSIWTARYSGTWDGSGIRDRLDELIISGREHGTKK